MAPNSVTIDYIRENAYAAFDLEQPMHREEAVFNAISEVLTEAGHFTMPEWAPISLKDGRRTVKVHAFEHDDEMGVITIIHLIDCHEERNLHQPWDRALSPSAGIERAVAELEAVVGMAKARRLPAIDEANPASGLCRLLESFAKKAENRICLSVWTTGELTKVGWKRSDKSLFHTEVWDASRICGILNSTHEPLTVDFRPYGGGIDCLLDDGEYERLKKSGGAVMLGIIPGECLADVYFHHRTRLLQQNVRAFLNFTGAVNRGIRDTIKTEPERFLSYNNGIAVTASGVELEQKALGVYRLLAAKDFQIVNGGQTTAAIMHTRIDNQSDLKSIQVAMKLTVVRPEDLDTLVPKISLYANSQNKVQSADFESNNPWLVKLEEFSRKVEASKDEKSAGQPIVWYFERVRGQYNVDLSRQQGAQRKSFKAKRPPRSKFNKTDLAVVAVAWEGEPQTVSLGRQKCFGHFVKKLSAAKDMAHDDATVEPSAEDFRRICCLLILRRESMAVCRELEISAYRANIIAYAMALLSTRWKTRLPFTEIWARQSLPIEVVKALRISIIACDKLIRDEAVKRKRNVTEFAKKIDCWTHVLEASVKLELNHHSSKWDSFSVADTVRSKELIEATEVFFRLSDNDWRDVSKSLERNGANSAYCGVPATMARYTTIRKKPSDKQARILAKGLLRLKHANHSNEVLSKLSESDWQVLETLSS